PLLLLVNVHSRCDLPRTKRIRNYEVFNIEGNEITEFPQEFEELTSMKGLNAANNKLTSVPEGIFNMKHLAILDLSGNLIEGKQLQLFYPSDFCARTLQNFLEQAGPLKTPRRRTNGH
ncbi:hypothetical protein OSTOST_13427, partial [Ostertagia ostertagi]